MESTTKKKLNMQALLAPLALSLLLTACATTSHVSTPVKPPQTPQLPPSLAKPAPQESYLERAQTNIEGWRKTLTGAETR